MRAIVLRSFGPPERLRLEEVPDPEPGPGQVRIAVACAGVHFVDTAIRAGRDGWLPLPRLPVVPGREVAGVVDRVGEGGDPRWLGRRVVAHLGPAGGGYAEMAVRDADAVHPVPGGLGEDEAVAMIGTGRTALAVLEVAALTDADVVLVTAAAGGLGTLLIQAGVAAGALVVALAGGPAKAGRARRLGAPIAVDYRAPGWTDAVREALGGRAPTVLLDGVGGAAGRAAMEMLDAGGRLVIFGQASGEPIPLSAGDLVARSLTATAAIGPRITRRPGGMRDLEQAALAAAAAGRLRPAVTRFPLEEAAAAHAAIEARETVGKVVLRVRR